MYPTISARIPRYLQIAEALRRRLSTRSNGTRLPSEPDLAARFRVSRETVREALAVLREEGLVYSVTGRGTFASPSHPPVGVRITQPIREPYVAGRPSAMRVLSRGYLPAPEHAALALRLERGAQVFLYRILRTIRRRPFRFALVYLPEALAARMDLASPPRLTVSEKLERDLGLRLIRAHQRVLAVPAPADVAAHLEVEPGAPVLSFHRTYYRDSGEPAEFVVDYQDSRRFPYEELLVRSVR
jgi:GntR family transcriptional regulator